MIDNNSNVFLWSAQNKLGGYTVWHEIFVGVYFCGLVIFFLFCGNLFLRLGHIGFSRSELISAIFKKYTVTSLLAEISHDEATENERKNERPLLAGKQYPALIIFSFLISTCNQGAIEICSFNRTVLKQGYCYPKAGD